MRGSQSKKIKCDKLEVVPIIGRGGSKHTKQLRSNFDRLSLLRTNADFGAPWKNEPPCENVVFSLPYRI